MEDTTIKTIGLAAGAAVLVGAVVLTRQRRARANHSLDWWFQRSPEAALVAMPIAIPGYLGARYVAKRYAPQFLQEYDQSKQAFLPEEDEDWDEEDWDEDEPDFGATSKDYLKAFAPKSEHERYSPRDYMDKVLPGSIMYDPSFAAAEERRLKGW